jgi:hypothetical protein
VTESTTARESQETAWKGNMFSAAGRTYIPRTATFLPGPTLARTRGL